MSFDAAIGRIDQILQFQQQLLYPSPASSSTGGAGLASTSSASGPAAADTDFATSLASAQQIPQASAAAASDAPPGVQAMIDEANSLIGKPYVWGGGHSEWGPQNGYDCSGFVSAVLHAGGYLSSPQDTQSLATAAGIEQGPGQYVTIYDRTDAGTGNDHVIIDLAGQFYESGGAAAKWDGGGVEKIPTPSAAYLASFNDVLHPAGL